MERHNDNHIPEFLPRDFVETAAGLLFAVVAPGVEQGRVLAFLRYVRQDQQLRKIGTHEANELLASQFPELLFTSRHRDVPLHGVPLQQVTVHHRPRLRLAQMLRSHSLTALEQKVVVALRVLTGDAADVREWGVTGSLLVGAEHERSDIDLVAYDRGQFQAARQRLGDGFAQGTVEPLSVAMWQESYQRRGCSLTFDQYLWHERRKWNKFQLAGTKIDLSWIATGSAVDLPGRKCGRATITATVTDDYGAFAYPAVYGVDHPQVGQIVSYNPTYTGQAARGERLRAAGWVEQVADGTQRLLVGTSRESPGEFMAVAGQG